MDRAKLRVGDKVSVDDPKFPGTWTIKALNPVNAVLMPDGGGRGLRAPYRILIEPGTHVSAVTAETYYHPGELVRITSGKYAGLWVVITDRGGATVSLARLGGANGQYLRSARRGLLKVDPADVLIEGAS